MATLVLIQKDLRLRDNPALYQAAEDKKPVIVVHVMEKRIGSASKWWLTESLKLFRSCLKKFGIPLLHLSQSDTESINSFMNYLNTIVPIDQIYSNGLDFELPDCFEKIHKVFMANLIFAPEDMDRQIKVFTPFWKYIRSHCEPTNPLPLPSFSDENRIETEFTEYSSLPVMTGFNWWDKMKPYWNIGEEAAQKRYQNFVKSNLNDYDHGRDFFCRDGTSKLSPHLRFGEISVRQLYHELNNKKNERYVAELGWREFAYHQLRHHPDMTNVPLNPKWKNFWPQYNESHLTAWKKGETGYPVIDAAMKDLWETGWMHNRLRMLVASFLVKNLMIPWQLGEEWFYDTLIDADVASNPFGWQWVAGCGTDSVPYFRIFNPMIQGEKFDTEGKYVKKWIPELNSFPKSRNIHKDIIECPNLRPKNYPKPIIDFKRSRVKCLDTLKALISPKVESTKNYYKKAIK